MSITRGMVCVPSASCSAAVVPEVGRRRNINDAGQDWALLSDRASTVPRHQENCRDKIGGLITASSPSYQSYLACMITSDEGRDCSRAS